MQLNKPEVFLLHAPCSFALYDGAALFASVTGDVCSWRCDLFEIVAFAAGGVEAFRAVGVADFFSRHGQMTVPAAQGFLSFRQEFEI